MSLATRVRAGESTSRGPRHPDRLLMFTTVLLCGAGLVMVTSASVAFAYTQHQSAFYYAQRQAIWMFIGFVALFVLRRVEHKRFPPDAPRAAVGRCRPPRHVSAL